ncbi:MAG: anti-sigma F factor [Clostridiaceae bacterium]|nr:anti-sigma F factor [Clostridiaceae bacterium]
MGCLNDMMVRFPSKSANEGFARVAVAAFVAQLDVTVEELADIKTAVSEAVTNAIVHGYENQKGYITVKCKIKEDIVEISVIDNGHGIEDIEKARQPLYTSHPELERSGMGFTVMETFMDSIDIASALGVGTTVLMKKKISVKE